jgi:CheY-like chemotaxis protein
MNLQILIIALTADATVDVEKCKSIGMNDYISKPLDEKLLYTKILDVLKYKAKTRITDMDYHFRKAELSEIIPIWAILKDAIAENKNSTQQTYPNPEILQKILKRPDLF